METPSAGTNTMLAVSPHEAEIREAVERLCAPFDDAYWLAKDRDGGFPEDFHRAIAEAGWLGIAMPEEYGGSGLGITEAAILMQAVAQSGAGLRGASALHMNIFGLNPVVRFGTDEQKRRLLPPLIAGHEKACFAVTEPDAGLDTPRPHDPRGARRRPLRRHRPQDLDLDRAGRRQDADARPHHAERGRGASAPRGSRCSTPISTAAMSRSARSRRWAARRSTSNMLFIDGLKVPVGRPHRRGGQRVSTTSSTA